MPRFSLMVPYLGNAADFEFTLASVLRHGSSQMNVIVPHDGSYQDDYELGDEVRFAVAEEGANLIRLFGCGLRLADSEFVGLLRPGVSLPSDWQSELETAFESDEQIASVAPALVNPAQPRQLLAAGVQVGSGMNRQLCGERQRLSSRQRHRIRPLGPTSWAAFYRRSALDLLGTPDESLEPVYFDLDVALGLQTVAGRCLFAPDLQIPVGPCESFVSESKQPHGTSAERAVTRHPGQAAHRVSSGKRFWEWAQAPFQAGKWRHCLDRRSAKEYLAIDEGFARRLAERHVEPEILSVPVRAPLTRRAA